MRMLDGGFQFFSLGFHIRGGFLGSTDAAAEEGGEAGEGEVGFEGFPGG